MSAPLLERPTVLDVRAVLCPDRHRAGPAHIEDRWTFESTDGPVELVKVRWSAGCWYTVLVEDLARGRRSPRVSSRCARRPRARGYGVVCSGTLEWRQR